MKILKMFEQSNKEKNTKILKMFEQFYKEKQENFENV